VLENLQPVLVDFWPPWCGPCHVMAPVIDQLATEFDGRATVGKVNVDEQPALAQQPTFRTHARDFWNISGIKSCATPQWHFDETDLV